MIADNCTTWYGCPILPGDPAQPCPELLTEEEAIRYLRLDSMNVEDPASTLRYYRKKGFLRATQVGKSIRYRRIELERLLDRLTQDNPR
ncbi:MAG: helix-turn-helix domain-containing protein [Sedimentisphaerales bacterium]|nr:helix-turn-helix domain-containing protein [Sedimentisphaerales bacterium]